jgi:hypothetical protein
MLTPKTIDQLRQNKPCLIVDDVTDSEEITRDSIYNILLSRGVFKWFSVRRKLIKLKDIWKGRVTTSIDYQHVAAESGRWHRVWYWRGYRKALEECRAEVRALAHSPRWQVQDNDDGARMWLRNKEDKLKEELILPSCESGPTELPEDPMSNLGGV